MQLADALRNAAITGAVVASCVFVLSWLQVLTFFRRSSLSARSGRFMPHIDQHLKKLHVSDGCNYCGLQASNSMLSFVMSVWIVTIFTFPLWYWPLLQLGLSYWAVILQLLLPVIVNIVIKKVFGYWLFANQVDGIIYFRGWLFYDMSQLFLSTYTGVTQSIVRVVMLVPLSLVSLMRLDEDLFPSWVGRYLLLDTAHKAFASAVYFHHSMNHPIMLTFQRMLLQRIVEHRLIYGVQPLRPRRLCGVGTHSGLVSTDCLPCRHPPTCSPAGDSHDAFEFDKSKPAGTEMPSVTAAVLSSKADPKALRRRAVRFRWYVAITLHTNGPLLRNDKPHRILVGWGERIDIHNFFYTPQRLRTEHANRSSRKVRSRSWICQSSGRDLSEATAVVLVEYRVYIRRQHTGVLEYPGRWHFMAFHVDSEALWKHFGRAWSGKLKPFVNTELTKEEQASLDAFEKAAEKGEPTAVDGLMPLGVRPPFFLAGSDSVEPAAQVSRAFGLA